MPGISMDAWAVYVDSLDAATAKADGAECMRSSWMQSRRPPEIFERFMFIQTTHDYVRLIHITFLEEG